jgi:hypothetical protein
MSRRARRARRPSPSRARARPATDAAAGPTGTGAPVLRLGSPAEILAAIPLLCGFAPVASLVVLSLQGPRKRIGVTMRFDLDWCETAGHAAQEIADRLAHDGAWAAVLVVWSASPDHVAPDGPAGTRAHSALVDRVRTACAEAGVDLTEALLVRNDAWTSYLCRGRSCCPDEGTPIAAEPSLGVELLRADSALRGRRVLPSRDDLVRSIAPPQLRAAELARQHVDRAVADRVLRHSRDGRRSVQASDLRVARGLLDSALTPAGVGPAEAAVLAVAVDDLQVRDEIAAWVLERPDELLAALQQVVRLVAPPDDAGVCALLAWVAYAEGNGALTNVALARALTSDPDHPLGCLLAEALHRQLAPSEVRRVLRESRDAAGRSREQAW